MAFINPDPPFRLAQPSISPVRTPFTSSVQSPSAVSQLARGASYVSAFSDILGGIAGISANNSAASATKATEITKNLSTQYSILAQKNEISEQTKQQLDNNSMELAMRDLSPQSPSFNAIQLDTLSKGQDALAQGTISSNISRLTSQSNIRSAENQADAMNTQSVIGTAVSVASLFL